MVHETESNRVENPEVDDDHHEDIIREADETLERAQEALAEGRARLQRAMARYAERKRG